MSMHFMCLEHNMFNWKIAKWIIPVLVVLGGLSFCSKSHDQFRYPCQNPANWDKDFCKMPICDVTRTCPEHIFKGQRDPRLGPLPDTSKIVADTPKQSKGVECGK